jgi:toxin ParE1/3/4
MQYRLTKAAKDDVKGIWNYTRNTWGSIQADRYHKELESCFLKIAHGEVAGKQLPGVNEEIQAVRCEHHYIFFQPGKQAIILRVLHEKMDFASRLKAFLDN